MGEENETRFGGRTISLFGMLVGLVIAVGLPYLVLVYGSALGVGVQATIMIIAVLVGGLISITAAFFGLVMPNKVGR